MLQSTTPQRILNDFRLGERKLVSIVGSGGKTSLLLYLAGLLRGHANVIISTTTKIILPSEHLYDAAFGSVADLKAAVKDGYINESTARTVVLHQGFIPEVPNKVEGIKPKDGTYLSQLPAITLIEADGSRQLPLKWWKEVEPVIPNGNGATIGVIPIDLFGQTVGDHNFYNLDGFEETFSYRPKTVDADLLIKLIVHPDGLFKNSTSDKILVFSRCETDHHVQLANEIVDGVRGMAPELITQAFTLSVKEMQHENFSHYTCRWPIQEDGPQ